ncbi:unnamed protein product [Amoebophrya sp. A120]|nr:unnamed protein product [Amoebophrya sp. A120]|eukprot:GSA120T00022421001.1
MARAGSPRARAFHVWPGAGAPAAAPPAHVTRRTNLAQAGAIFPEGLPSLCSPASPQHACQGAADESSGAQLRAANAIDFAAANAIATPPRTRTAPLLCFPLWCVFALLQAARARRAGGRVLCPGPSVWRPSSGAPAR